MIDAKAVINIVAQEAALDPASLTPDTDLKALGITSLDMMNVLFSLEDATGVIVEAGDLSDLVTLGDFIAIVEAKMAQQPTADPS